MTTLLPKVVLRDDTEHGTKYCTLLDALAYGAARAAAEREEFEQWQAEGVKLFERAETLSACFAAGVWWGDRPWRKVR